MSKFGPFRRVHRQTVSVPKVQATNGCQWWQMVANGGKCSRSHERRRVPVIAKLVAGSELKQDETSSMMKQDIVLYDGHCRFCTRQIETLKRLDGRNRLRFLSLHDPSVATDFPDLSFDQLMAEMWVISIDGVRYGGANALRYLSRRLPILWPVSPLLHFPGSMPIWKWLYRQVAKRRYRIAGRTCEDGTCSLHR